LPRASSSRLRVEKVGGFPPVLIRRMSESSTEDMRTSVLGDRGCQIA